MEQCERDLRSDYQVHLMVPGKKQEGPISMVAKTYKEALPALASLFEHLIIDGSTRGRIHRNVKDPRVGILEGSFLPEAPSIDSSLPYWLFQSPQLSVLTCSLLSGDGKDNSKISPNNNSRAVTLQTCLDNIVFRLGKEAIGKLEIFMDPYLENSFAVGDGNQAEVLRCDIAVAFQNQFAQEGETCKTSSVAG